MAGPLIVGAEGVILIPDEESYGASRPLMEGLELVTMLRHFPTTRTIVVVGTTDTDMAEYFVKLHGLDGVNVFGIAPEDKKEEAGTAQWYAIERLRSAGPIGMVLTAWHSVYERCKASHQPVLLFARRGALGLPAERPTWDDLHQRTLRHREAAVE
jgi:hypothetical protein